LGLHILLYHRIQPRDGARPDLAPDLVSATPELFDRQLRYLARYCSPVGADEVMAAIAGKHRLPRRAVLVTFDDGYRDFAQCAWPLLKKHRIPCVLFAVTAFSNQPTRVFWWDAVWQLLSVTRNTTLSYGASNVLPLTTFRQRRRAYLDVSELLKACSQSTRQELMVQLGEQLRVQPALQHGPSVLAWNELRQLAQDGVIVAPHSQCHELLDQVEPGALRSEVSGSRDDVVREIGQCPPLFAYPNGNFDARVIRALTDAGFAAALTTIGGRNELPTRQPFMLRREQARGSLSRLAVKLSPQVARWRTLRKPLPTLASLSQYG
jgi:peptidoglycan/xylan/chitin deacetylase (PgdA/CDA1 family)